MLPDTKIYLASASPRRQELLRQLGIEFEVFPAKIAEVKRQDESPEDYVTRIAADKARFTADLIKKRNLPMYPVLGADTEVVLDGDILGKPQDRTHGMRMLRRLSASTHEVLTAVTLWHQDAEYSALNKNLVTFGSLTDDEIRRYWETGEPTDKAGGYAIQGHAAAFISRIEGSYSGVVGLPLYELRRLLEKIGRSRHPASRDT